MGREVRHGFLLAVMAGLVPAIPIRMAYRVNNGDHRASRLRRGPVMTGMKIRLWSAQSREPAMPSTILDSAVFRDIFTTPAMRQVWSDENRVQKYLDFEAALARAQGAAQDHPAERRRRDRAPLRRQRRSTWRKLKEATERIGYPVLPVVQQLVKLCKDGLGEWCALGRHHAGHHRHRDRAADPRGAGAGRERYRRASATRSPRSPRNTATRRWPAAAICSRRCRSPSATRWRPCSAAFERHRQRLWRN